MRRYINIGSSPSGEDCAKVGSENYNQQSKQECQAFINQLRRQFGNEPGTANLIVKTFPHDFGSYREVVCFYDDDDEVGRDYAYKLESETPEHWDTEAELELNPL